MIAPVLATTIAHRFNPVTPARLKGSVCDIGTHPLTNGAPKEPGPLSEISFQERVRSELLLYWPVLLQQRQCAAGLLSAKQTLAFLAKRLSNLYLEHRWSWVCYR